MKGWMITILAVVGGYAVFQWFTTRSGMLSGGRLGVSTQVGPLSAAVGVGDYYVSPLASGVPVFNSDAIANGHGDQVAAAYHTNPFATTSGGVLYEPAFGPNTNQVNGSEMSLGL
jgi:hypothetical protein